MAWVTRYFLDRSHEPQIKKTLSSVPEFTRKHFEQVN